MLPRLARLARLYVKLQVLHLQVYLEYDADFWIGIVGLFFKHAAGLAFVWTLFTRVAQVKDWGLWEVACVYALAIIPMGLVEILCDGQWQLRMLVTQGEFDRVLLRPLSPLLQVITQFLSIHGFGSVVLGAVVLSRAALELHLRWGPAQFAYLAATLAGSVLVISSLNLVTNCIVFWDQSPSSSTQILVYNLTEFAKFPIDLYGHTVQFLITWIVPLTFVSYYPALMLLGKAGVNPWLAYAAPLAGPVVALLTGLFWQRCLAHYQGAGN